MFRAEVRIELKPGVADPEGANTKKALELLGFSGVQNVKSVHAFSIDLAAPTADKAKTAVDEMCKRLLVNPVIHTPRIEVVSVNGATKGKARSAKREARKPAPKKKAPAKKRR